jgi:hypothetical protein
VVIATKPKISHQGHRVKLETSRVTDDAEFEQFSWHYDGEVK